MRWRPRKGGRDFWPRRGAEFPKRFRLLRSGDFQRVGRGHRKHGPTFTLLVTPGRLPHPRVGVTVARTVGDAVTRNRVKRRVREIVRLHLDRFAPGDYVLIAKPTAATATYAALSGDVLALFSQITSVPKTQPPRGSHPGSGRGSRR